jgi:hypothetical protein
VWKLAVALFFAGAAGAQGRTVCLEDRVGINVFTWRVFEAELRKLAVVPEIALASGRCEGTAISLVISAHPPARYAEALGLAHRRGERVFPALHLYTQSVRKIIGEQASAAQFGRALARVAAHELEHYLHQRVHHVELGLMRASFEASQLASEDSGPFRADGNR